MSNARLLLALFAAATLACGTGPDALAVVDQSGPDELGSSEDNLTSNKVSDWFPVANNNEWVFKAVGGTATRTVKMTDTSDGVGYLEGLLPGGKWIGVDATAPNTLYGWSDTLNAWKPFLRFGYAVTPWEFATTSGGPCDTLVIKRSATGVNSMSPAGLFKDGRSVSVNFKGGPTVRCAAPPLFELTFHPSVGLVSFVDGQNVKYVLTRATVGGKSYPTAAVPQADVRGFVKLDKVSYQNIPNTIRCVTTPCPSNGVTATAKLTYTVTNYGSAPFTYQFTSGCQMNVEVLTASGAVVKNLAIARLCTQALSSFTLAPGASKSFSDEFTVESDSGEQLAGSFKARASLQPRYSSMPAATASAGFTASIQ
jgi:hypothetical protein